MKRIGVATGLLGVLVTGLLPLGGAPTAAASRPVPHAWSAARPLAVLSAVSLAGEQWHYRAQVDGRGGVDRITITAQPGFTLSDGFGTGQVHVHVDFAGSHRFAEAWQDVSYYSARTPWTPWLGATDLDRRGGREIVLGFTTGAHTQGFTAYTYRPDGELLTLRAPHRQDAWLVNSSVGTGTSGWKCTRRGVQSRAVSPAHGATATVKKLSYAIGRNGDWRRTGRIVRQVRLDSHGNPPVSTARFARFACAGLPKRVL